MKAKMIFTYFCVITVIILISYHAQAQSMQPVKPPGITGKIAAHSACFKDFYKITPKKYAKARLFNSMNN